ncbi:MAG: hypothetical protein K2M96_03215 [Prevotella sp.]|nr:hypothetical protein [Prevotella sp.]
MEPFFMFCGHARHHARTRSAPCADAVGIMHGHARHHARTRSAPCTDTLGIMHGHARHHVPTAYRLMT